MQQNLFKARAAPIVLRPYQQEAVDAVYRHLREREDNPLVVIPTGGGKTPIIATICRDAVKKWSGRVVVLAHVKELLQQSADKLAAVCPDVPVGLYSAGLGKRESHTPVVVAGIQSIYKRACDLDAFDLAIVDEAHLIPPEGEGMYREFLADAKVVNPNLRIIGLTATPYRMKSGSIATPEHFLNHVCYEIGVRELIVNGYLSPLISKNAINKPDMSGVHVRGGEFVPSESETAMDAVVEAACSELVGMTVERKAVLIFAAGVQHGQHVAEIISQRHGVECGFVSGETADGERAKLLQRFIDGDLKYLCNVNVLTTGFDAPHIDCVVLLRPTLSPGLYYQMVGRGFRLHPGKSDCLVLDFGGNVLRHGPVDQIKLKSRDAGRGEGEAPAKECPECQLVIAAGYARCPACGYAFPPSEKEKHGSTASTEGVLSTEFTTEEFTVSAVSYGLHKKRDAAEGAPRTLRVEYEIGWEKYQSEWICLEHDGWPRRKAEDWWRKRSLHPVPDSIERAVEIANGGGLAEPSAITVRNQAGEKFGRVVNYVLGPIPDFAEIESSPDEWTSGVWEEDEIPF